MRFTSAEELRAFLRICIDPGAGRDKRTPTRLVEALPREHAAALDQFAPGYLGAMGRTAAELTGRADDMRHAYASTVLAWIREEQPSDRLLDLAQEATAHARSCSWCSANGVLSHRCADGRRLAAALLAPVEDAPVEAPADGGETACAHESWDVTSEYRDGATGEWVQGRRCNDCRERLDDVRSAEPHYDEHRAETAAALGHRTVAETAAAYVADVPEADQPTDDEDEDEQARPALPAALPWLSTLRGHEFGNLLGEIALAMHKGQAPHRGESTDERHRRTVGYVADVLAGWRDAVEHRRPTTYVTNDGRAWTYRGEHQSTDGPALYESPTSPRAYTFAELSAMYRWVAAVEGGKLGDDETVKAPFEDYARTCRVSGLTPYTTAFIRSGTTNTVHAAVHVALNPDLELSTETVDEMRAAVSDGLAYRED
ncbi:hypothetical protein [Streptomyces salinarius]|uniref:hypothetical protein n=1 Tax=Streptomyces salinarius TaxID=2762598 RepID=UPI002852C9A7|nr:hypothetical protein [Streptomyces salinarius]